MVAGLQDYRLYLITICKGLCWPHSEDKQSYTENQKLYDKSRLVCYHKQNASGNSLILGHTRQRWRQTQLQYDLYEIEEMILFVWTSLRPSRVLPCDHLMVSILVTTLDMGKLFPRQEEFRWRRGNSPEYFLIPYFLWLHTAARSRQKVSRFLVRSTAKSYPRTKRCSGGKEKAVFTAYVARACVWIHRIMNDARR